MKGKLASQASQFRFENSALFVLRRRDWSSSIRTGLSCSLVSTRHSKQCLSSTVLVRVGASKESLVTKTKLAGQAKGAANIASSHEFPGKLADAHMLLSGERIPKENEVLSCLEKLKGLATKASYGPLAMPISGKDTAVSTLLALNDNARDSTLTSSLAVDVGAHEKISQACLKIMVNPKVFITEKILALYVDTQTILRNPRSFPQIFDLFASKPVPNLKNSPTTFSQPNPDSMKAAVPLSIASKALDAAIQSKNLILCLNIVRTTTGTRAYRRRKFWNYASIPSFALAVSPIASIMLGRAFAGYAERLDPWFAFWASSLCFMTYFGMVALSGYIAAGTAFHTIDRVSWRPGVALHDRWLREDERAFIDRIAQAWGFSDYLKRGQETGVEWDNLRIWCLENLMELDKPELMEHME